MEKKSGFQSINAANVVPFGQNQKPVELYNLEIEQMVLGAILADNLKFEQAAAFITADSFYAPPHARIWEEIKKKIDNAEKASPVTLNPIFKDSDDLKDNGGAEYLVGLVAGLILPDVEECAKIIRDFALRRTMLEAVETCAASIKTNPSIFQSLQPLEIAIHQAAEASGQNFTDPAACWLSTVQYIEKVRNGEITVQKTKFNAVDEILGGVKKGCLYVLAGATGMGKTAFALNIADNIAQDGKVLYFSIEMGESQLQSRRAAAKTGISIKKQDIAITLTNDEMRALAAHKATPNLIFVDKAHDLSSISNMARKFIRKFPDARLVVVDYLQLLNGNPKLQRVHQIEEITKALKKLSIKINLPIILLSQLSRGVSGRDNKRPMLSDLRDSGAIEQDADVVMFVYREEYYLRHEKPIRQKNERESDFNSRLAEHYSKQDSLNGKAEILIEKNRYGETGVANMNWDGQRTQFSDIDSPIYNQNDFF